MGELQQSTWRVGTAVLATDGFDLMSADGRFFAQVRKGDEGNIARWPVDIPYEPGFVMVEWFRLRDRPVKVAEQCIVEAYGEQISKNFNETYRQEQIASRRNFDQDMGRVREIWRLLKEVWQHYGDREGWDALYAMEKRFGRKPEVEEITPELVLQGILDDQLEYGQIKSIDDDHYWRKTYAAWKAKQEANDATA